MEEPARVAVHLAPFGDDPALGSVIVMENRLLGDMALCVV